ncbi:MAG: hypothetical protein FD174_3395 [Geobacteraceae bacterium]|nr:MAG: hypothetical protein FD174_3395 [Geobacteraceae bacterium]
MVVGFNHNIMYKGEIFHIQTEDSGVTNPHIITLLYRGGTIISSKKTGYADIIKIENLDKVVEELMKEQHKEMLRRLKAGEFDDRAFGSPPASPPQDANGRVSLPVSPPVPISSQKTSAEVPKPAQSLDEIILDCLTDGEDK